MAHLSQLLDEELELRVAKEGGKVALVEARSHCGCTVHQQSEMAYQSENYYSWDHLM